MKSYDYVNRDGFVPVTWERFGLLCQALAEEFQRHGVEAVVGIARPGLFPAAQIALSLRTELFPVRVTRRVNDEVVYERPVWKVPVSPEVAGKVVAVVDEIADTGESLGLVAQAVRQAGAARVITAALAAHTWASPAPDLCPLVTDSLVLWPWDQRVLIDGRWVAHPELVGAAAGQGKRLPAGWDDRG
ncbi:MAG: phosphoribosyltransferase [Bacillota bacterium]